MTTPYEIPFRSEPETFLIALGGQSYRLTTTWCDPQGAWVVDIERNDGTPVLKGIPLQPGADLLAPYEYLDFGGKIIVRTAGDAEATPSYTNLGVTGLVFFVTEP